MSGNRVALALDKLSPETRHRTGKQPVVTTAPAFVWGSLTLPNRSSPQGELQAVVAVEPYSATIFRQMPTLDPVVAAVVKSLAGLEGTVALTLGGSRSSGTHLPHSDWDVGLYYRAQFSVDQLRRFDHAGKVAAPGEWGRIMNGGAWWNVEGRTIDILLRDLDVVDHWTREAQSGRFEVDNVHGYLAGLPTYSLSAELALGQNLVGELPRPAYPDALRETASRYWSYLAAFSLLYSDRHAESREVSNCVAAIAKAAVAEAQSRLAANGKWVLNEKGILALAGLQEIDDLLLGIADPGQLSSAVKSARRSLNLLSPPPGLPPDAVVRA
jgi:hypothetical protein